MVHKNPNPSKLTTEVPAGEDLYECWTNELEWLWARGVRDGCFVILVVSIRGCWLLYNDAIADNPDMSEEDLKSLKSKLAVEAKANKSDEYETYGARAYVIGPTYKEGPAHKADRVAHQFCQSLANHIVLRGQKVPAIWAEFKTYDGEGQSSSSIDDEANTIEVFLDDNDDGWPDVYINGKKQPYSSCKPTEIFKQGDA